MTFHVCSPQFTPLWATWPSETSAQATVSPQLRFPSHSTCCFPPVLKTKPIKDLVFRRDQTGLSVTQKVSEMGKGRGERPKRETRKTKWGKQGEIAPCLAHMSGNSFSSWWLWGRVSHMFHTHPKDLEPTVFTVKNGHPLKRTE